MKKLFVLLLMITGVSFSQNQLSNEKITNTVETILELSQSGKYAEASNYIAYTGTDESRKYKSKLNAKDAGELKSAERMLKKIKAYLSISDSHEIVKSENIEKSERTFTVVEVAFISGQQKLNVQFEFVNINNDILLANIE